MENWKGEWKYWNESMEILEAVNGNTGMSEWKYWNGQILNGGTKLRTEALWEVMEECVRECNCDRTTCAATRFTLLT